MKSRIYLKLKVIRIVFSLVFLTMFLGCLSLDEEQIGQISPDTFYQTESDFEAALSAMYFASINAFNTINAQNPVHISDDISSGNTTNSFDILIASASNGDINGRRWRPHYRGIYGANGIIGSIQDSDLSTDFKTVTEAQARFWRGLNYYYLTQAFGTIPLVTEAGATGDEQLAAFQEIFDLIINDLQYASDNLPSDWGSSDLGRPDQWAAKSFLASAYLTGAGFPLKNGSYAALAAFTAKDVKDNSGNSLLANIEDLWLGSPSDHNAENVFEYEFSTNTPNSGWGGGGTGRGNFIWTQATTPAQMDGIGGGWNELYAELTFFNEFPAGARKDATFQTEALINGVATPWQNWNEGHPVYGKYIIPSEDSEDNSSNFVLMRLAEVLLIHAEALAMADGGTTSNTDALDSYNQVRTRAGLATAASITVDDVVQERAWELAAEFKRYFDLIRTETLDEAIAKRDAAEPTQVTAARNITEASPWLPIPASEVQANPNLAK